MYVDNDFIWWISPRSLAINFQLNFFWSHQKPPRDVLAVLSIRMMRIILESSRLKQQQHSHLLQILGVLICYSSGIQYWSFAAQIFHISRYDTTTTTIRGEGNQTVYNKKDFPYWPWSYCNHHHHTIMLMTPANASEPAIGIAPNQNQTETPKSVEKTSVVTNEPLPTSDDFRVRHE
jgi:hypothetical protein